VRVIKHIGATLIAVVHTVIQSVIRNIPVQIGGSEIRRIYYKRLFKMMGKGGRIEEGVIFYNPQGITCGSNVSWGRNMVVQGVGILKMGDDILIGPGCFIWTVNHDYNVENFIKEQKYIQKPVTIENNIWIGANAKITPGVKIGTCSVIGMGSVVTKDVPPNCIVAGNPARVIRKLGNAVNSVNKMNPPLKINNSREGNVEKL